MRSDRPASPVKRLDALFRQLEPRAPGTSPARRASTATVLEKLAVYLREIDDQRLTGLVDAVDAAVARPAAASPDALQAMCALWANTRSAVAAPALASAPARPPRAALPPPAIEVDDEITKLFIGEALDHLGSIETSVLVLERQPDDARAIDEVFRPFHTIKGNAAALGFAHIEELSHGVEDLLDRARSGAHRIGPPEIEVVLAAVDLLAAMVRDLESRRPGAAVADYGDRSRAIQDAIATMLVSGAAATGDQPAQRLELVRDEQSTLSLASLDGGQPTIKVDTSKLDNLLDLVGELVIVQSMIQSHPGREAEDERFNRSLALLHRITSELHRGAIALRLVPIRQTFHRMRRIVRDLGQKSGKAVELMLTGEDTDIDRKVVEQIVDPLMHMLRNSIDHGIEDAAARTLGGKPEAGQLSLGASYEGGHVVVSIADDGRGLDTEKLYQTAVEKGLVERGAMMSDAEIHALIFHPGFSTATEVTGLSGRGVGMDVVRRNVESLRGRIEIRTRAGLGTTFLIKLPLTLATIEGLLVGVGRERFVLPTHAVHESLRPSRERLHAVPGRGWLVEVRKELLPVVRLADLFSIHGTVDDPTEAALVVVEDDGRRVALMVDELIGKQDVVIKSLGEAFVSVEGVAGGAILADGRIGLILDAAGLIRMRGHENPSRAA